LQILHNLLDNLLRKYFLVLIFMRMLFNSLTFVVFFVAVFILYWSPIKNNLKHQNILLLIASYYFYACWDYRFLFLLVFSISLDYFTGLRMHEARSNRARKAWFWCSVVINLGLLGVFKYYNFFIESFVDAVSLIGMNPNVSTLNVILPVGISFYTFHGLSYVIDIYNKRIEPVKNFIEYSVFVSFFPLLVAGPIERATHLLPQIQQKRVFNYHRAVDGLKQILYGLFKKVVIADGCAEYVNMIFNSGDTYSGSTYAIAAVLFAFQIYCDFSGYSDIALGVARLLGIDLLRNFAYPYFSRDIAEFWRRWHISLSSWFRDYLYIPLGGNKGNTGRKIRNIFIIFIVSGLWHGANTTFIFWGALNAIYFLPLLLLKRNRSNIDTVAGDRNLPSFKELLSILTTFALTTFAWIFFRSENIGQAFEIIAAIFSKSFISAPEIPPSLTLAAIIAGFVIIEWLGRFELHPLVKVGMSRTRFVRWTFYSILLTVTIFFYGNEQQFIYFQF